MVVGEDVLVVVDVLQGKEGGWQTGLQSHVVMRAPHLHLLLSPGPPASPQSPVLGRFLPDISASSHSGPAPTPRTATRSWPVWRSLCDGVGQIISVVADRSLCQLLATASLQHEAGNVRLCNTPSSQYIGHNSEHQMSRNLQSRLSLATAAQAFVIVII